MTAHAKLSASGSHRWIKCPGSVKAEDGRPDTSSEFANEGSAAHELGELVLVKGGTCSDWIGKKLIEWDQYTVDQEMADYVQVYVDYVKLLGGKQVYERRFDFSDWVPDGFGTSDATAVVGDKMHVIDLKYGKGVLVSPYENTQGILYALGAYAAVGHKREINTIAIHIVQPRMDHIETWELSLDELLRWGERITQAAELAMTDDAPRNPGEKQCQWCKAKADCPALKEHTESVLMSSLDDLDLIASDKLSDAQMLKALQAKKLVVSWFDAIEKLVVERLETGDGFPGYKLVAGRSSRQWASKDIEFVAEQLEALVPAEKQDSIFEINLVSPAKAEKLVPKALAKSEEFTQLIIKSDGKPTLAPVSDKRPAINLSINDFDEV